MWNMEIQSGTFCFEEGMGKGVGDIESVASIRKRATKLIPQLEDLTYIERRRILKIPTLAYRKRRGGMLQIFKNLNGIEDNTSGNILG